METVHGVIETPVFMPVGTQATVKAQDPVALEQAGSQILLANTYHLLLRPGLEVFRRIGGIHAFMCWPKAVLTDSGGYQIFSLPHSRSMSEEGAVFVSYVDGRPILLSPEKSIEAQLEIGSDIMMVLDQCVPSTADEGTAREALRLTRRWARRSLAARGDRPSALFGIVQGALYPELRRESALGLAELPFEGFAIGGLAVGEGKTEREETCELTTGLLPQDKPRYLMGVGTPLDILEAVHRGVDMFDCIIPTQVAQRGGAFTSRGFVQLRRGVHKFSNDPLDPACGCPTCRRHNRAYLHHLTKTQETLGWQLIGTHNIYFYHELMRRIRAAILEQTFGSFYRAWRDILACDDLDNPVRIQKRRRKDRLRRGKYEVEIDEAGHGWIRDTESGERMHDRTPPMEEARQIYIGGSRLAEKLLVPGDDPIVIWDVGLGAASNAMAAIECQEALSTESAPRPLKLVSFESDLDPLRLAIRNTHCFPELRHPAPAAILELGQWCGRGIDWQLLEGDFFQRIGDAPGPPDLIFYDLFSMNSQPEAWGINAFRALFRVCAGHPVELLTYSCSTGVRAAMLGSGFYVARGQAIGAKAETTIAVTSEAVRADHELLSGDWLVRLSRSSASIPADLPPGEREAFERQVLAHPQFAAGAVGR